MIALSTIPLNQKAVFEFLKSEDLSKIPDLSGRYGFQESFSLIEKPDRRDIMNMLAMDDKNDFWRDMRLHYIEERNKRQKRYSGNEILRKTCGDILYEEQIEQLILESCDFNTTEAALFRKVLKEGKNRTVSSWKIMWVSRIKNIFNQKKDVNTLLNSLEAASKYAVSGKEAQEDALKLYLTTWFIVNKREYFNKYRDRVLAQICLYCEHGIDIGDDFLNFEKQTGKKFKKQFDSLIELFAERSTLLAMEEKYNSARDLSDAAAMLCHYSLPNKGQLYLKLMRAQLYMDTGDPEKAKEICHQTLKTLDPSEKDYDNNVNHVMGLLEMIEGEMWKSGQF